MLQETARDETLRVGLVGAGRGGRALLQLFASVPTVQVVAVADPDPDAPGLQLARGIPVVSSHREIFAYAPQIVIEVTGRPEVYEDLARTKPIGVELIGAQSARLFWETVMLSARDAQQFEKAETIRRMAGGVFHNLANIFTALLGRASLLLRSLESGRWTLSHLTDGLTLIAQNVSRGNEILNRLRGFMRESAEQRVMRVDVNDLVREVVALADPLIRGAQTRSATIEVRQELGEIPRVLGRGSELVEVVLNLIVNAIEAMPDGGVLTFETTLEGFDVLLRVRDTGVGISDEIKAQLFTPFFTTKAGGTGLGLSVSREIIRRHGGDLTVESLEGEGSCFTIRLPGAVVDLKEKGVPLKDLRGWRVLVVDDDPFSREVLGELLATVGCQVRGVSAGQEALTSLKREIYDLVVADIVMPDITGWEVARAASEQNPSSVVILVSGWSLQPDDPSLQEIGAAAFLRKPVRLPELVEAVEGVLAGRPKPER